MLKRIWGYIRNIKKKEVEDKEDSIRNQIEFSKLDKYMGFLMRERLGTFNRDINDKLIEIKERQEIILHNLSIFHKKSLMNSNIPQREIQIMEGNRDTYVKRLSHFVTNLNIPKDYLEMYDYCIKFSERLDQLGKEMQKNTFVLSHFFENEIREINKELNDIEKSIIDIRVGFEKNNIKYLEDIKEKKAEIKLHKNKILDFTKQIKDEENSKKIFEDKLQKLSERTSTITTGTDYKTLQNFRQEKELIQTNIKYEMKEIEDLFSDIYPALRKYYYKNPDKKILRDYFDVLQDAFLNDKALEITEILKEMKPLVENESLELKDKKKETVLNALSKLTLEFLKNKQATLNKLITNLKDMDAKILHNSSALNLSENQYWTTNTQDKINQHNNTIDKLKKEIQKIEEYNASVKTEIETDLEKLVEHKVELIDDYDGKEEEIVQISEDI